MTSGAETPEVNLVSAVRPSTASLWAMDEAFNNFFTPTVDAVLFADLPGGSYRVTANSPLIDNGADISTYNIKQDF